MTPVKDDLTRLGAEVRDALPPVSSEQAARQRAAIVDDPAEDLGRPQWRTLAVMGVAAAAAIAIVWAGLASTQPESVPVAELSATFEKSAKLPRAPDQHETERALDPRAPAVPTEAGATILESGRIEVATGADRKIVAGPYVITSPPGGAFELSWDAEAEALTLEVDSGEVAVTVAGSHHVVVAGDVVHSSAREFVVVHSATAVRPPAARETKKALAPWVQAAKRGEYRAALTAAKTEGVLERLASLNREELKLLADATRLGGGSAKSASVLLELRRRFPKSTDAKRSAFYLGRAAESDGRPSDAVAWYREYLKRSPKGSLAAQARGRLLKVLSTSKKTRDARDAARDYLAHHPKGAYASLAATLVESSSSGAP